jgi:hypothetical protein
MSRYTKRIDENTLIAYGYDRGGRRPGYFYQIEKEEYFDGRIVPKVMEGGDTRAEMVISENEEQMNRSEIAEKLREYDVREEHVEAVAMDQQF